jgi:ribose 5-phosphate isomerase B
MKIAIGGDHAGFEYKAELIQLLEALGYEIEDFGPNTADSVDYPDHVHPTAASVESKASEFGILICGSGNGVAMTANKHQGIRAALCWTVELAQLARQHNDANILCLPARFVSLEDAKNMANAFVTTDFEGGRHQGRVDKISC